MSMNTTGYYLQITREIMNKTLGLSKAEMMLFLWLNEMEQREHNELISKSDGRISFLCTDKQLHEASGLNLKTIQSAKKVLQEKGFILVERGNWKDKYTKKSSIKQPCKYTILR